MSTIDRWMTRVLDRLFEKECIQHDGTPVMYRWILARRGHGAGIYIHHFVMSDGREMHDHPKPFTTIGLKGGYREASAEPGDLKHIRHTEYRAPWIRRFPPHHIHRVILEADKTCWTLRDSRRQERTLGVLRASRPGTLARAPLGRPRAQTPMGERRGLPQVAHKR